MNAIEIAKEIKEQQYVGVYTLLQRFLLTEVLHNNPKPTDAECNLLDIYQDDGYCYMNMELRDAKRDSDTGCITTTEVNPHTIALNDFILSQTIPVAMTLYRGQKDVDMIPDVGSVFTMNAFTSTTLNRTTDDYFGSNIITIEIPEGTRAFYMNNHSEGRDNADEYKIEHEVLIAANSTFKVTEKYEDRHCNTHVTLALLEQRRLDGELLAFNVEKDKEKQWTQ